MSVSFDQQRARLYELLYLLTLRVLIVYVFLKKPFFLLLKALFVGVFKLLTVLGALILNQVILDCQNVVDCLFQSENMLHGLFLVELMADSRLKSRYQLTHAQDSFNAATFPLNLVLGHLIGII